MLFYQNKKYVYKKILRRYFFNEKIVFKHKLFKIYIMIYFHIAAYYIYKITIYRHSNYYRILNVIFFFKFKYKNDRR